jgi:hypothetical protein
MGEGEMGKISGWRVLLGGLFAGAILFIGQGLLYLKLAAPMAAELMKEGLAIPATEVHPAVAAQAVLDILTGFLLAWLYAAIRPRLGAGLVTAIVAGLAAWTLMFLQSWAPVFIWSPRMRGLAPLEAVVSLVLYLVAASVAAWLYSEAPAGSGRGRGR